MIQATSAFITANQQLNKQPAFAISIGGYWRTFTFQGTGLGPLCFDWIVDIGDLQLTVDDLHGSANLSDLVFTVQDFANQLTADLASIVLEGKTCQLFVGFVGMGFSDFMPRFTGVIDSVDSDGDNLNYKFTVSDVNLKKLTQKIFATGDDGFPTSDKHPKTLLGHPLDILVVALNDAGVTGIDLAKIHYYRDFIFSGLSFEFTLTGPPTAKDFIEKELMVPLGCYLRPDNLGNLTIQSFYPTSASFGGYTPPPIPAMQVTISNDYINDVQQANIPVAQQAPLFTQLTWKFEDDGTGSQKFKQTLIAQYDAGIRKYGLIEGDTIESQGMRTSFQGGLMASFISNLIFLRYGNKNLVMDPTQLDWKACVLEPGDVVAVSNPFIPDRQAGILGVSNKTFEVLDCTYKLMSGVVEAKLLALDISKFTEYLITPNGETFSDTNAQTYMFQSNDSDTYSDGTAGDTLG